MSIESQKTSLTFSKDVHDHLRSQWCNAEAVDDFGQEECEAGFERLLAWLATPPMYTTLRLNTRLQEKLYILQKLTVLLDQQYQSRGQVAPEIKIHSQVADLAIIPNSGPHEMSLEQKEVVVGLACGMAVLRGADVYAQGVMAAPLYLTARDKVSIMADVEGVVCKGLAKPFTGRKVFVGNGTAEMSRIQLFGSEDKPSGCAVRMTSPLYTAPSLSGLLPDIIFPQNLPSVICAHVLGPKPGQRVLDMCAAPGGKTTHIATLMNDEGVVVALDKSKGKIKTIRENATKWGLSCIHAFHFDGTKALDLSKESLPDEELGKPPFSPETFDCILLDAPCSALGQRPAVHNVMKLPEVTSYPPLQRKLFTAAVGLLKPGGVLVYSTCTWTMEENEGLVAWALKTFPNITLQPQEPHLGGRGRPGRGLSPDQLRLVQRFGPPVCDDTQTLPEHDTIAFFCAKFVKAAS